MLSCIKMVLYGPLCASGIASFLLNAFLHISIVVEHFITAPIREVAL